MENPCESCGKSSGCTDRMTDERTKEEVNGAPILIFAAIVIVLTSIGVKWLLL